MTQAPEEMLELISDKLNKYFAATKKTATEEQVYKALALVLRDKLLKKKQANNQRIVQSKYKRVYYLCMEFLLGRSLKNNLYNLGLEDSAREALGKMGFKLDRLYELESDAGLGNGGLGRLAACFMDSLASLNYPAMGFSIRYEYGLFRQKIVECQQVELPDMWLNSGEVWQMPRSDKNFQIKFGGRVIEHWENGRCRIEHVDADVIEALPYDMMISGGDSDGVSVLRLWSASGRSDFDMKSFTQGDYVSAMRADNKAELINKVLYPSDDHEQGKQLRLSQQYFMVSASLQNILKDHLKNNPSLDNLPDLAAIHINDTHPALAVPELMRLLVDEHGYDWDTAWNMTTRTIAYTNHTVMAEALEKWHENLFKLLLPRIYMIIKEIDRRYCNWAMEKSNDFDKVNRVSVLGGGMVRMANLAVIGSHAVNGVSALHSEIIKESVFRDFYTLSPEKFTNVTNGIAHRRWLSQSNPGLKSLITDLVGDPDRDAGKLEGLLKYKDDKRVLAEIGKIKHACKVDFAKYIKEQSGFVLNPESRIDTQIKRLHEYKRQLMNVLKIISQYLDLCDNPDKDVTPQTFVFGAKAAGGYYHAKRIISLINCLSEEIQKNPKIKEKLDVLFVENYNVTRAERLIPASEVSEQISLAGKEASGTSNMKFMLNGAITLGTLDGANVEIRENVGDDNIFIFGLKADEAAAMWGNYFPSNLYTGNHEIRRIVDRLREGFNGESFADIANYLILGSNNIADPYMCLYDLGDYMRAARDVDEAYKDKERWNRMALVNIAKAGVFASDRSIEDYAQGIWNLRKVKKAKTTKQ